MRVEDERAGRQVVSVAHPATRQLAAVLEVEGHEGAPRLLEAVRHQPRLEAEHVVVIREEAHTLHLARPTDTTVVVTLALLPLDLARCRLRPHEVEHEHLLVGTVLVLLVFKRPKALGRVNRHVQVALGLVALRLRRLLPVGAPRFDVARHLARKLLVGELDADVVRLHPVRAVDLEHDVVDAFCHAPRRHQAAYTVRVAQEEPGPVLACVGLVHAHLEHARGLRTL